MKAVLLIFLSLSLFADTFTDFGSSSKGKQIYQYSDLDQIPGIKYDCSPFACLAENGVIKTLILSDEINIIKPYIEKAEKLGNGRYQDEKYDYILFIKKHDKCVQCEFVNGGDEKEDAILFIKEK